MFQKSQSKLHRVLVFTTLVSVLSLLPASAAPRSPKSPQPSRPRSQSTTTVRPAGAPILNLFNVFLSKLGAVIDPNGNSTRNRAVTTTTDDRTNDTEGLQ